MSRKTYTPSRETLETLREIYELEGSYAGTARVLNRGRQSKDFTPRQISRMLKRENVGRKGSGYTKEAAPAPVVLTPAQQRSLQRKSKETSGTYQRSFEESNAPNEIYDSIKNNIEKKRERLRVEQEKALRYGQRDKAEALAKEIQSLNKFDEELNEMAEKAVKYKDWKGMQDAKTP